LHQVGDLFELNVNLRCQNINVDLSNSTWGWEPYLAGGIGDLNVKYWRCLDGRQYLIQLRTDHLLLQIIVSSAPMHFTQSTRYTVI